MFNVSFIFILVVFSFLNRSYGWVFNNVDYSELAAKSFDMDEDYENEISSEELPMQKFNLIFPGTKWCGAGNIAEGYDDLGPSSDSDRCCRDHDNCPDVILAGETKYNLTNDAYFTRLNCECDERFRRCLRAVHSKTSRTIGKMYFNALGTRCFRQDYPVTGCNKTGGWLGTKCIEYSFNTNGQQIFQWFDVPNY